MDIFKRKKPILDEFLERELEFSRNQEVGSDAYNESLDRAVKIDDQRRKPNEKLARAIEIGLKTTALVSSIALSLAIVHKEEDGELCITGISRDVVKAAREVLKIKLF